METLLIVLFQKKITAKQKNCFPEKYSGMEERAGNFFMQRTIWVSNFNTNNQCQTIFLQNYGIKFLIKKSI